MIISINHVTSRGINQNISARSARSIVLYPTLKTVTPPVIPTVSWVKTIAPKILAAPISVVWLWLVGSQQTYFQLRAAFYLSPLAVQKVTTPLSTRPK